MAMLLQLSLIALSAAVALSSNATVYIIRHGEKTFWAGCLNVQGQERANNMGNVFDGGMFLTPNAIFANNYHDDTNCERCWLTVQQRARELGLTTIFDYGYHDELGGNAGAAVAIKAEALEVGVVLVAWEHRNIQYLAEELGVEQSIISHWEDEDFDSVYVLDFDTATGDLVGFSPEIQNYVPESTTCPPEYNAPQVSLVTTPIA